MAREKRAATPATWVFRIACIVFSVCLVALAVIGVNYWLGSSRYDKLADEAFDAQEAQALSLADWTVDWDALRAINPDTIAWVYMPGTAINYPVVKTEDNNYYIKTDFEGETNWVVSYGAIFLDARCNEDLSDQNVFIYGHNMNNGAMFANIEKLTESGTFNAHRSWYLLTPQGNCRMTTFALDHVSAYDDLLQPFVGSSEELAEYIQDKIDRSVVSFNDFLPDLSSITKTFALITCDNLPSNGRYVLYSYVAESTIPAIEGLEDTQLINPDAAQNTNEALKEYA